MQRGASTAMKAVAALAVWGLLTGMVGRLPASAAGQLPDGERVRRLAEVRSVEIAFAASVTENRPADFAGFLDDEAVFVGGGGALRGRNEIVAAWSGFFAADRPEFEWHPEIVELSRDGTLGFTRGPWTLRTVGEAGETREQSGLFNSIWQRQADGGWKIVFDAGCSPCPACAS